MKKLRPNEERARGAIMVLWLLLAVEIVVLISSGMFYSFLQTVATGGVISEAEARANAIKGGVIGVIYFIVYLTYIITFIMWFRRAYFNLHQKSKNLQFSEGWAAGSWFVPILGFYRPFQIMHELYTETKRLLVKNGVSEKDIYPKNYLASWWTLYILTTFVGNFVLRVGFNADTIDSLISATVGDMIVSIFGVILALLTIKVIKDYSKVEPLLAQIRDEVSSVSSEEGKGLQAHSQLSKSTF